MSTNPRSRLLRPAVVVPGVVALLAGLAWLAFGYFGIHTAFIDERVDEAAPVFDATPAAAEAAVDPVSEPATEAETEVDAEPATAAEPTAEPPPVTIAEPDAEAEPASDALPEIVTELVGTFVSEDHPTSGTAAVLGNGTEQRFLRFEGFATDNGPDLNVYLFDDETGDFVDLGDLKGNIGDQNYEIPADVDLDRFDRVSIWCVRFGVGFGSATLMPTA